LALFGGAAVSWPLAGRAQEPERMRRIGLLIQFAESDRSERTGARRSVPGGTPEARVEDGDNLRIDYRWGTSNDERARAAAAELLKWDPM
jgi:putative ABC transport system substrate-binding protein